MAGRLVDLVDLARELPATAAIAGIDLGTKTIGVAISDLGRRMASPLKLIERRKFTPDAEALTALLAAREAAALVVGLPLNMDGSEGPRAQSTRAFARNLAGLTQLPIGLWDERLSTSAVERELIGMDVSRARRAEVIDEHAAIFILQGALDRLQTLRGER